MTPFPCCLLPDERVDWLRAAVKPLAGWCYPNKAVRLAELVIHSKATVSVDLGVFGARSTIALAEGHRQIGHGYVTGIDPWSVEAALEGTNTKENDDWWSKLDMEHIYRNALRSMEQHCVLPHWQILRLKSKEAAAFFADGSVGVCHIDGNHSQETSCEDVRTWLPKMAPNGIVICDDTNWESLKPALELLTGTYGAELAEEHVSWQVYRLP